MPFYLSISSVVKNLSLSHHSSVEERDDEIRMCSVFIFKFQCESLTIIVWRTLFEVALFKYSFFLLNVAQWPGSSSTWEIRGGPYEGRTSKPMAPTMDGGGALGARPGTPAGSKGYQLSLLRSFFSWAWGVNK